MNKLLLAALATAFTTIVAIAQSVVEVNGILTDASGRTLYTFDKDADYKSNCNAGCAAAWPPYLMKDDDRISVNMGFVRRDDNTVQWALNGKPLYYFAADTQRGDVKGDGQGGVWHVIRSAGMRTEAKPAATTRGVEGFRYDSGSY